MSRAKKQHRPAKKPQHRLAAVTPANQPQLLVGAKQIAAYVLNDVTRDRWVYERWRELGCFLYRGQIVARPETLDQRIRAKEAASAST
jgi:hypothetical protein